MAKKSLQAELLAIVTDAYNGDGGFPVDRITATILRSRRIKVTWAKKPKRNHER